MAEDRSPIQGFNIYYQIFSSNGKYRKFEVQGALTREAELLQLMPNTRYSIKMTAYNTAGESVFSNTVLQTTQGRYKKHLAYTCTWWGEMGSGGGVYGAG